MPIRFWIQAQPTNRRSLNKPVVYYNQMPPGHSGTLFTLACTTLCKRWHLNCERHLQMSFSTNVWLSLTSASITSGTRKTDIFFMKTYLEPTNVCFPSTIFFSYCEISVSKNSINISAVYLHKWLLFVPLPLPLHVWTVWMDTICRCFYPLHVNVQQQ